MGETAPAYSVRELQRLAEAPLRRPWLVIVPLAVSLGLALALSFLLPPRYRSSTLILVAPEQMPASFVPQMTTEKIGRRLQTLRQEVQSRTRLELVAREFDPYGTLGREPLITTIERMRDAVAVSVKGNDAFSIEFEHRDPKMAMLVADRLTTLFMEEVVGASARQVSTAYEFIEKQLQEARAQLEEKEAALREYKERHMGQLPEQVQANLATLQRLQLEQQTTADSLRKATDALLLLEAAAGGGGGAAAAAGASGALGPPGPPESLAAMRALLTQLKTRYTDQHPDVRALQGRIDALEKAAADAPPGAPIADPAAAAYQLRLREARVEVQSQRARLADVDRRIAAFQARVEAAPRREQEILGLTRDYQKLSENYTALLSKKLDAEMASRLEQQQKGQQFRVLDPAFLPERPSFPNRGLFALAGALAGILLGVGLAVVVDVLDPTMKDADTVAATFSLPVLAVIPYVKPREQARLATLPLDASSAAGRPGGGRGARRTLPFRRGSERGRASRAR
jgi:polysaccharide chain length determinant protein (PEP-CTERM system associated)